MIHNDIGANSLHCGTKTKLNRVIHLRRASASKRGLLRVFIVLCCCVITQEYAPFDIHTHNIVVRSSSVFFWNTIEARSATFQSISSSFYVVFFYYSNREEVQPKSNRINYSISFIMSAPLFQQSYHDDRNNSITVVLYP